MRFSYGREPEYLFSEHDLGGGIRNQEKIYKEEIAKLESDRILNTSIDDLANFFAEKFKIEVPKINEDGITVDTEEVDIDVSGDHGRIIHDRSEPFYIKGTKFSYYVPYEGDKELFKCQPSSWSSNPPRAILENNEIILVYSSTDPDAELITKQFKGELGQISSMLERSSQDTADYNSSLHQNIKGLLEARKEKILKDRGMASSLGFPMRKRADAPATYVVDMPKKVEIKMPAPSSTPFTPEPELEMKEYEHILSIISNMVQVIERSPSAFAKMDEESLRQHFLVQLNGQYAGQATAETFNYGGKTDILIRVNGKNIFIAECKFWKGAKHFQETIDQILGYTSWRDTKTSILLFNRNHNFTEVIEKAKNALYDHPGVKRKMNYKSETGARCVLKNKDDENRELVLTLEVFNVPEVTV